MSIHVSADSVRMFLVHLEESRGCAISTRNQRLAAIHSLARFVALHSPEHIAWCEEICVIPFKKCTQTPVVYLEKAEIDALLAAPNLKSAQGQRDHLLLLFLYNTGARADEAAQVLVRDLNLAHVPSRDLSWVRIRGKGNKLRHCPLWPQTVNELQPGHRGKGTGRARLSESVWPPPHPFRRLSSGETTRRKGPRRDAIVGDEKCEPTHG